MRFQLAHENRTIWYAKLDLPYLQICQKTYNHEPGRDPVTVVAFRVVVMSGRLLRIPQILVGVSIGRA